MSTIIDAPALLTAREVAALLRITPATVLRQAGHGLPAAIRIGGQYRWKSSEIHALLGA